MEHVLIAGTHTAAVSIAGLSNEERPELAFDLNSPPFVKFDSGLPSSNTPEGPHSAAQPGADDGGTQAEKLVYSDLAAPDNQGNVNIHAPKEALANPCWPLLGCDPG
jgi:hypothetical protein